MSTHSPENLKNGYTLVETLIYAVLFVILLGAIVSSIVVLSNSYRNVKAVRDVETSAVSAMNRITREIKGATSIDGIGTNYNVASGSLLLNTLDDNDQPTTLKFYLSGGVVKLDKNGVYFGPLTDPGVVVTSLIFRDVISSSSEAVKIEMNIQNTNPRTIVNKNFYDTIILRSSY